jgi:DNA-binding transcriptional ArsR family regulator
VALPPDHVIAKALGHPIRARVLAALDGREASPTELSRQFDVDLGNIAYHVKGLERDGLLRLVRTEPRRGALEHFYTAAVRARIDAEAI